MREIKLTQGKVALVDDADFEWLNQWKWTATRHKNTWYAYRNEGPRLSRKTIYMHRRIMEAPPEMEVDHDDSDGLHNWRGNLQVCTHQQNQHNRRKQSNNTSGYIGVTPNKKSKKYDAQIWVNKSKFYLGSFDLPEEAARTYDKEARKHGYKHLNFPSEQ